MISPQRREERGETKAKSKETPQMDTDDFLFNDTTTTEIYTLSLHDALPISPKVFASRVASRPPNPKTEKTSKPKSQEAERRIELADRKIWDRKMGEEEAG